MKIQHDQYWLTANKKLRWISSPDTWRPKGRPAVFWIQHANWCAHLSPETVWLLKCSHQFDATSRQKTFVPSRTICQVVNTQVVYAPWGRDAEPANNEWAYCSMPQSDASELLWPDGPMQVLQQRNLSESRFALLFCTGMQLDRVELRMFAIGVRRLQIEDERSGLGKSWIESLHQNLSA